MIVINVKFNAQYAMKMMNVLQKTYFNMMIHSICENKEQEHQINEI